MPQQGTNDRKLRRKSVNDAAELLRTRARKVTKDSEEDKVRQISSHCISTPLSRKRKRTPVVPLCKSLITTEMRSYAMRQDWRHMQHLFPLLLDCSNELEPVMWRYAMLILLYSPNSKPSDLDAFINTCIGNDQEADPGQILEKLLSLSSR